MQIYDKLARFVLHVLSSRQLSINSSYILTCCCVVWGVGSEQTKLQFPDWSAYCILQVGLTPAPAQHSNTHAPVYAALMKHQHHRLCLHPFAIHPSPVNADC